MDYTTPIRSAAVPPVRPQTVASRDTDERAMMVRLFGRGAPGAESQPVASPPRAQNDEFAPHLGRHVDVVA